MERYCQSTPTQQQQAAKQGPIEEANESLTATFKLDFLLHFHFGLMPDPKAWRTVNPSPH
ncbi:hypothetical protein CMEL01_10098 [Colletotrichum melonis]|uniref:Uncharacterized protein n=1 Tax=Colletotrichum melonis TaxID=1209925 RepID=A0AAI9XE27_9PEZI|nr:hypothetical protein CMEL01_10098 [Colletotrichum melonis]